MAGFSLVELGVALVALGMLATGVVAYWKFSTQHTVTQQERSALDDANAALRAFVQARHRLPCPDTDDDGVEGDADGCPALASVGRFPWKTVGVFHLAARELKYGVYRAPNTADARLDVDLTLAQDRYSPLVAEGSPMAANELLLGQSNLLDFCRALDTPVHTPVTASPAHLSIWTPGDATSRRNVAYVLAAPGLLDGDGDGDRFDGANAHASDSTPAFELPTRGTSEIYDDSVVAGSFQELFAELGCGSGLSAIGHGHANAALSAAMLRQGINDYRRQLQLLADAAGAGVASGTANLLMSTSGLSKAIASSLDAASVVLVSQGTASAILAPAILAIVANTAATVTAAAVLASAIAFKVEADGRYADVAPLVTLGNSLSTSVDTNFRQADQAGF
jgi:hypothetical protein